MRISIVVPCYNEAENIPLILERFGEVIKTDEVEVILVNNGSTDNSAAVLEELLQKYPFAKTVLVPVNQGYGYGILQGLDSAQGEYIGWTHADMQTDPADVLKALEIIRGSADKNIYV
ncbi:MAG: glycosyltransferase family 2 protein, partial [Clostridiales bacterium]|nr:glycosyltransferase family 2 protein [Clostridiales bacterium]